MKLLVYSDGGPSSERALHFAAHLVERLDAELAVITSRSGTHAIEPQPPFGQPVDLSNSIHLPSGLQILSHALGVLEAEGVIDGASSRNVRIDEQPNGHVFVCQSRSGKRIPFYVCFGHMIETLNYEIDLHHYDLLIIAPPQRGKLRKMMLGDTTRKLVLDLHTSILIVRGGGPQSRFVVCADGSTASKRQSGLLLRLLPMIGPPVELVWVRTPGSTEAEAEMAEQCFCRAQDWMAAGGKQFKLLRLQGAEPAEVISSVAGEDAVIFMGASLRHDVYRRLVGSLPMQLLDASAASVLVVKGLPEGDPEFP
jgi:nucleotide-binding universal stress UspA family protein